MNFEHASQAFGQCDLTYLYLHRLSVFFLETQLHRLVLMIPILESKSDLRTNTHPESLQFPVSPTGSSMDGELDGRVEGEKLGEEDGLDIGF